MYDWIPISEVKPGDLIRAPVGGSSWAYWRDREQAEAAASVPFLRVERIGQNPLSPEMYQVSLEATSRTGFDRTRTS